MICIINKPLLYLDLYQKKPVFHHNSKYSPNSWTSSIESAQYMGNKIKTCLYLNRRIPKKPYRWFLTIYFHRLMTPETISKQWNDICSRFKKNGIIAFWIREFTVKSKVHYHILIVNNIPQKELEKIVEKSVTRNPDLGTWHKNIKPINKDWNLLAYITKSKVSGFVKGKFTKDKYAKKRLLFLPNLGPTKHGKIGDFWIKPWKELWKMVQEREAKIAKGLSDDRILELGAKFYDECLFTIKGMTKEKAQRKIALWYDFPETERWIEDFDKTGELFSW